MIGLFSLIFNSKVNILSNLFYLAYISTTLFEGILNSYYYVNYLDNSNIS